jgi:hypothetical protein
VGEGLGKVAEEPFGVGAILFGIEADVVGEGEEAFVKLAGFVVAVEEPVIVSEPKAAR